MTDFHDFLWQRGDSLRKDESNDRVKFLCHNSKDNPFKPRIVYSDKICKCWYKVIVFIKFEQKDTLNPNPVGWGVYGPNL